MLHPLDIDRSGLVPQKYTMSNGGEIHYFRDSHIDIVRLDFIFPAGTSKQTKKLLSSTAIRMIAEGTRRHSAREIAEFMDFRGIVMEQDCDVATATLTVYSLTRHLPELLPLLREIINDSIYPEREFEVYMQKRRQQFLANMQKTSYVARNHFYEHIFGPDHIDGQYASLDDFDLLTVDDVRSFKDSYISLADVTIVLSGNVSDDILRIVDNSMSVAGSRDSVEVSDVTFPHNQFARGRFDYEIPQAVQCTLRLGRLLPFDWADEEYARFMIVSTALGGYFGSRLMQNIREDKGYTYGINAITRVGRSGITFCIFSDVAAEKSEQALVEIKKEMRRMREEPMPIEELALVRNCMLGDFMRSIDGIFERAERYGQMLTTGVTEKFTDNYMSVLSPDAVTTAELQQIAGKLLREEDMVIVSAGKH